MLSICQSVRICTRTPFSSSVLQPHPGFTGERTARRYILPRRWCPYCNIDLEAIEAAADEIRTMGASLVLISMQTAVNSRRSQRDNKVSFPIHR